VAKRRKGRYPAAFRQMAVERMKGCENIVALSEELGVSRRLLYRWRHQLDPIDGGHEPPTESPRESTLRKENHQLKRVLANKVLEVDFFKGALQKVEARRPSKGTSGETASTTRSGK
jgi:transposase